MNKNNDAMICINDLYFEDTEDMRKLSEFILQLEREKFFYESAYRKVFLTKEHLRIRNKKLYNKCHVYKVELNRCQRKLARIYKKMYGIAFYSYVTGISNSYPKEVIDVLKNM